MTRRFRLTVECDVVINSRHLWPDGNGPADPTVDDVKKLIEDCGGAYSVVRDWNLDNELYIRVSDEDLR